MSPWKQGIFFWDVATVGKKREGDAEEGNGSHEGRVGVRWRGEARWRVWEWNLQDPKKKKQQIWRRTGENSWGSKNVAACCSLCSWEITWPHNLGYPVSERENNGDQKRQNMRADHLIPTFSHSFHLPLSVLEGEERAKNGGGGGRLSSFFHPVLPGGVQFLEPSLSISSRLLLSISCSSLLPPHLPWSSLLGLETAKPGRGLSQWKVLSK